LRLSARHLIGTERAAPPKRRAAGDLVPMLTTSPPAEWAVLFGLAFASALFFLLQRCWAFPDAERARLA